MIRRLLPTLFLLASAFAQSSGPAFEVASIRLSPLPLKNQQAVTSSGPNLTLEGFTWIDLVVGAYNLKYYQLSVSENVVKSLDATIFYTIQAKAEGDTPRTDAEFRSMSQALLTSRFRLKVHRETRNLPVYALVVGKDGVKLKPSDPAGERSAETTSRGRNEITVRKGYTMSEWVYSISGLDKPIVDQTGLSGRYDITLETTPEYRMNNDPLPGDISIFTAVQESLGLRLEATRAPIEILVVDSIEKPTEN